MKEVRLTERPLITAVAVGFLIWVVLLILAQVLFVLVLILLAVILAAVMMPVVRYMRRARFPPRGRRIPRWTAVLIIYMVLAAVFGLLAYWTALVLIPQAVAFVESLPQGVRDFVQRIDQFEETTGLTGLVPSGQEILNQIQAIMTTILASLGQLQQFVGGVVWFFFGLFFVLILALFLVVESEAIVSFWVLLFPPSQRDEVRETTARVGDKVGYWVLAQITVATIVGILAGAGAWALGLPFPVLIGAAAAILELAPVVGPSLMAIPAGLLGLTRSPLFAVLAVLYFYGLSLLDGHLLTPLITGRFVRLPVSLVLVAVPFGLVLYGPIGALVAIPVVAGLAVIFDEVLLPWLRAREGLPSEEPHGPDEERRDRAA